MLVIGTCTLPVAAKQEIHDTQHRFSITVPMVDDKARRCLNNIQGIRTQNRLAMITINKQPIRTGENCRPPRVSIRHCLLCHLLLQHDCSTTAMHLFRRTRGLIVLATEYRMFFRLPTISFYRDSYLYLVLATTDADQSYYSSLAPVLHSAVLSIVFDECR